ncbi:Superoxide dismutase [Mn], partial [Lamellibrachia satsuma]
EPDSKFAKESIFELIKNLGEVPEKYRIRIGNQGGGFFNHAIYFACLSPNPANATRVPTGKLLNDITSTFGSYEAFQEKFTQEAASLFGSGYVWLVRKSFDANAELAIVTTANQDSPITDGLMPLLVIDVWEHAYYLKHEYRRNNYVDDWWMVVDWVNVAQMEGFWLTGKVDYSLRDEL